MFVFPSICGFLGAFLDNYEKHAGKIQLYDIEFSDSLLKPTFRNLI